MHMYNLVSLYTRCIIINYDDGRGVIYTSIEVKVMGQKQGHNHKKVEAPLVCGNAVLMLCVYIS